MHRNRELLSFMHNPQKPDTTELSNNNQNSNPDGIWNNFFRLSSVCNKISILYKILSLEPFLWSMFIFH
jgi:hypothetical protein